MSDLAAMRADKLQSIERIQEGYAGLGYICSRTIATAIYVACQLEKPILIEGPAGVGKTELANTTSAYLEAPLIRLQCYEGCLLYTSPSPRDLYQSRMPSSA